LVVKLARKLWPPPDPPPPKLPPPEVLIAGAVPLRVRSFRVSPPVADTSCRPATVVTEDELIEASVAPAASVLVLTLVPAAYWYRSGSRSRTTPE